MTPVPQSPAYDASNEDETDADTSIDSSATSPADNTKAPQTVHNNLDRLGKCRSRKVKQGQSSVPNVQQQSGPQSSRRVHVEDNPDNQRIHHMRVEYRMSWGAIAKNLNGKLSFLFPYLITLPRSTREA